MTMPRAIDFLGIGGIGMSALARWAMAQGMTVSGYDKTPTPLTDALSAEGARVLSALPGPHRRRLRRQNLRPGSFIPRPFPHSTRN